MVKTKCLRELNLVGTAIKELPSSIGYLESLETINLRDCSKFGKFPEIQAGNMKCLKELKDPCALRLSNYKNLVCKTREIPISGIRAKIVILVTKL